MNCLRCKKREARVEMKHLGDLCKPCFLHTLEKRARKYLRTAAPIKKGEKICVLVDESKESKAAEYFLDHIFEGVPCEVEKRSIEAQGELESFDKVFYPLDADDIAEEFLGKVFEQKEYKKRLTVLGNTMDSEIKKFMELKEWTYEKKENEKMIKEIEKMYPGSTFGIIKSKEQLE